MANKASIHQQLPLTPVSIDETSEAVTQLLTEARTPSRQLLQIRLGLEEILLRWMERGEDGRSFTFIVEKRFGSLNIFMRLKGEALDPLEAPDSDEEAVGRNLLASLGLDWAYQYVGGVNQVSLTVAKPRRLGSAATIFISMAGALAVGLLTLLLPVGAQSAILNGLVNPIFTTFLGFVSAAVGPLMFVSVAWSICSLGDPAFLGKVGKKLFSRWMLYLVAIALTTLLFSLCFFPLGSGAGSAGESGQLATLWNMLLDIVPDNFITPFANGNTLQILFLAVLVGVIVSILKRQVDVVARFLEQTNLVMRKLLSWMGCLMPAFVFLSIYRIVLSGQFGALGSVSGMLITIVLVLLALLLAFIIGIRVVEKTSPMPVLQKLLPPVLLALTTASTSVAFPLIRETCEKKLGIQGKLVDLGIPLGIVAFKPTGVLLFILMTLLCGGLYGVTILPQQLPLLAMVAILLSMATPPVPGGALTCYTLLFTQMGIPLEALALAGMLDMLLDFPFTAFNVLSNQVLLLHSAYRLNMVDREVLCGGAQARKAKTPGARA